MPKTDKSRLLKLAAALILTLLLIAAYLALRPQAFELLAKGTDWVLVACGFADREDLMARDDDRWRRLYYAMRMFKSTPPRQLMPEDAAADRKYPGMGFGIVHTFSRAPVSRVIGGWLFSIPCVYFTDAQDCQNTSATIAQLTVDIRDLAPIGPATIDQFLAVNSPETMRLTIKGLGQRPANWWWVDPRRLTKLSTDATAYAKYSLPATNPDTDHYHLYVPPEPRHPYDQLQCTDPRWAAEKQIMDHCLSRFTHNDSVYVEIKFPAQAREQWPRLREAAATLVKTLQVRR